MVDDYLERYRQVEHAELFRQLNAGAPARVDAVTDAWRTVEDTMTVLATSLRRDLSALSPAWSGSGSREYQHRLGLIAALGERLAEAAQSARTGLSLMSAQLAQAQQQAEPDPGAPTEWALDGVLGPSLGRTVTAAQRASAHEQLARQVAQLALGYALAERQHWPTLDQSPADLPGGHGHHDRASEPDHKAAQHAGHRVSASSFAVGSGQAPAQAPAAPAPAQPQVVRSVLAGAAAAAGAGAGLTKGAAHHVDPQVAQVGGDGTGTPASGAAMPPMGGTGVVAGPPSGASFSAAPSTDAYYRPVDAATSWSTGETTAWLQDTAEPPPPAVIDGGAVHKGQ
jgi:hypothetical protein